MNGSLLALAAAVAFFVLLAAILRGLSGRARYRYTAGKPLMSPIELVFYRRLRGLVEPRALVFPKVRIADVLSVADGLSGKDRLIALNVIAAKHTDFVIADPVSALPIAAIELDDASHGQAAVMKRDSLVNAAFESAGMRLLRLPLKQLPTDEALIAAIFGEPPESTPSVPSVIAPSSVDRACPKCGSPMVIRRGKGAGGGTFWGCSSFPRCKATVPA